MNEPSDPLYEDEPKTLFYGDSICEFCLVEYYDTNSDSNVPGYCSKSCEIQEEWLPRRPERKND